LVDLFEQLMTLCFIIQYFRFNLWFSFCFMYVSPICYVCDTRTGQSKNKIE